MVEWLQEFNYISQNEIERTSQRTKIGLAGAIKVGNISHRVSFGYKHIN